MTIFNDKMFETYKNQDRFFVKNKSLSKDTGIIKKTLNKQNADLKIVYETFKSMDPNSLRIELSYKSKEQIKNLSNTVGVIEQKLEKSGNLTPFQQLLVTIWNIFAKYFIFEQISIQRYDVKPVKAIHAIIDECGKKTIGKLHNSVHSHSMQKLVEQDVVKQMKSPISERSKQLPEDAQTKFINTNIKTLYNPDSNPAAGVGFVEINSNPAAGVGLYNPHYVELNSNPAAGGDLYNPNWKDINTNDGRDFEEKYGHLVKKQPQAQVQEQQSVQNDSQKIDWNSHRGPLFTPGPYALHIIRNGGSIASNVKY